MSLILWNPNRCAISGIFLCPQIVMAELNVNSGLSRRYDRSSRQIGGNDKLSSQYIDEQVDRINQLKINQNNNGQFGPSMMNFNGPPMLNQFGNHPMMPPSFKPYDPYKGFLEQHGLIYDPFNHRRFISTFIDVNSKFRGLKK